MQKPAHKLNTIPELVIGQDHYQEFGDYLCHKFGQIVLNEDDWEDVSTEGQPVKAQQC